MEGSGSGSIPRIRIREAQKHVGLDPDRNGSATLINSKERGRLKIDEREAFVWPLSGFASIVSSLLVFLLSV